MNRHIEDTLNQIITKRGISVAAISSNTEIPGDMLYRSFRKNRRLRADEFVKICIFMEIDPRSCPVRHAFTFLSRGFGKLPNKQFCSFDAAATKGKIRKCGYTSYACYGSFSIPYNNETAEMPTHRQK